MSVLTPPVAVVMAAGLAIAGAVTCTRSMHIIELSLARHLARLNRVPRAGKQEWKGEPRLGETGLSEFFSDVNMSLHSLSLRPSTTMTTERENAIAAKWSDV